MPVQNRVDPFGEILALSERGKLLGNRGELKVESGVLIGLSRWKTQSWIYCLTDEKLAPKPGKKPLRYTKLFFMDEPTALAAGHRPCCSCQPERFEQFIAAWLAGNPQYGYGKNDYKKIDKKLHEERKNSQREKVTYPEKLANLKDGVMVSLDMTTGESYLVQDGKLRKWSPSGYSEPLTFDPETIVQVLTPKSVVNAINAGFKPKI
jgi:hypothetical protein